MREEATKTIDIRSQVCPMTWVRVKLALEAMAPGQVLRVLVAGEEPLRNLPRSAASEGHAILRTERHGSEGELWIRRGGEPC